MKDIVLIPKDDLVYIKPKYNKMERYIKVPETWEELKELCKDVDKKLVKENNLYETQITMETDKGYYAFYQDGTIIFKASNSINYKVATNRTMPQIFQFIKSLIGEE